MDTFYLSYTKKILSVFMIVGIIASCFHSPQKGLNQKRVDMRIETYPLPAKYGGQPCVPIRHMNVDVYRPYPTALPLPQPLYQPTNSYHIVL